MAKKRWQLSNMYNAQKMLTAIGLLLIPQAALAADKDILMGFELGGSIDKASEHAESQGWRLLPLESDTIQRRWIIEGANADLYVCDGMVLAVRRDYQGGIDKFASLVQTTQFDKGLPETSIITFRSGPRRISNIDAKFSSDDGSHVTVQLSSIDGTTNVSTNTWKPSACADENE